LADIVRAKAPEVMLHVKVFPNAFFRVDRGVSAIGLSQIMDFAGCDSWTQYSGSGLWAFEWQDTWMWLDMLRSVQPRKPVFNSENHLLGRQYDENDPWLQSAPEQYFYAVFMGEAVHGQYPTLIWGRYPDKNIQDRPKARQGLQRAVTDLQRVPEVITMLSDIDPQVVIFHSLSTAIAESASLSPADKGAVQHSPYMELVKSVYEKMMTSGVPVSFAFEELPLVDQVGPDQVLIVPGVTHLQADALRGIVDLAAKGKKVMLYNSPIKFDEHGLPLPQANALNSANILRAVNLSELLQKTKETWQRPQVSLYEGGVEATGVEWRYALEGSALYLFVLNHSNDVKTITIDAGEAAQAFNVLDDTPVSLDGMTMQPLDIKVLKIDLVS
jgi:hypothetical protein